MNLHSSILLSAVIIAAGMYFSRPAPVAPLFASDLLAPQKTISRADVIAAVDRLDRAKLLVSVVPEGRRATDFRVLDAKAMVDQHGVGVFGEVVFDDGTRSPVTIGFLRDSFGDWTATVGDQRLTLAL